MPCPTTKIPDRLIPLVVFLLAAFPLAAALVSQYGFGLAPCHLCVLQRIPYAVVMGIAVLVMLLARRCPCAVRAMLYLAVLAFLANGALALFHTGVEQQWWQGRSWWSTAAQFFGLESCSGAEAADSVDALRAMLEKAPIARCDQPSFIFLGLSMAGWNGVYALFAALFTLKLGCRKNCSKGNCNAKPE